MGFDDGIVKRIALLRPLKLDRINPAAGQTGSIDKT
jgi:hypothetical protein